LNAALALFISFYINIFSFQMAAETPRMVT